MKKSILKYGVLYGVVSFLFSQFYLYGLVGLWMTTLLGLLILFVFAWLISKDYKAMNDGYAEFGALLKYVFIASVIGLTISLIFGTIQSFMISEETKNAVVERMIESTNSFNSLMIKDEEMLMELEEQARENFTVEKFFSLKTKIIGFFQGLFGSVIMAAIAAAIFKKNPK
jgi:hypothetical protein